MAHFARIENNIVVNTIVVHNNELMVNGVENETKGKEFCHNLLGGEWIQTSYNGNIRKQYAGIGYTYNPEADVFVQPKPFPSWVLDSNYDWQPPIPMPEEGHWHWDEESLSWLLS